MTRHLDGVVLAGSISSSSGTFPRYEQWTGSGSLTVARNLSIKDAVNGAASTAMGDTALIGKAIGGWLLQRFDHWGNASCIEAGACAAHDDDACDDNDACTADSCNKSSGCVHSPISGCSN